MQVVQTYIVCRTEKFLKDKKQMSPRIATTAEQLVKKWWDTPGVHLRYGWIGTPGCQLMRWNIWQHNITGGGWHFSERNKNPAPTTTGGMLSFNVTPSRVLKCFSWRDNQLRYNRQSIKETRDEWWIILGQFYHLHCRENAGYGCCSRCRQIASRVSGQ